MLPITSTLLRVNQIKRDFGNLKVLNGISFSVEEGEILGIAGPNGAGKTTLFNLISGMMPVTGGSIFFQGRDITTFKSHRVSRLGIARTFQTPVVFPTLTVRENVSVGAVFGGSGTSKRSCAQITDEVLKFLSLSPLQDSPAENLHLYDRKMVMLGAVLATKPKLLLLDEPAAGLPKSEIESFMSTILRLNNEFGITILIIEHLIDWLRDLSRKMLIIHSGVVMAYGIPDEVVKDTSVIDIYLGKDYNVS